MMIWRSLSPQTLAAVIEFALARRTRAQAVTSETVEPCGGARITRSVAVQDRMTMVDRSGR